ncbi:2OG-Fe(II) oxygenase [bacterium]|jgi:hypothetical protein|nr:2OG-Fe(II) oxygenase [bacterium]
MNKMLFLEKEFRDLGFQTEQTFEEILLVRNFISNEELNVILDIIKNTPEDVWFKAYRESLARFCLEKFGRDDVENLVAEGKYEITKDWDDKNLDIGHHDISHTLQSRMHDIIAINHSDLVLTGFATLQRMQQGVQLKAHTDQHTDPSIRYAAILYLNDDYKDGTLFFVNKDIDLRPKPGDLLIFPGNEEYEHGVRHVGDGPIRYVLVGFIKVKGFYENNKY